MKNELIKAEDYGLEPKKGEELTSGLKVILEERKLLIQQFEEVSKMELCEENEPIFRELRLKIRDNRTKGIEKWRKANKAFFLYGGKFVDAKGNLESDVNIGMEDFLIKGEKFSENLKKERLNKLQIDRVAQLDKYVEDAAERNLSLMEDDVWDAYLTSKKNAYNDRVEAENKAEAERLENERLDKVQRDRQLEIAPYIQFLSESLASQELRTKPENEYKALISELQKSKIAHDKKQAEIQAENDRLKKEREDAEAKAEKEKKDREAKEAAELKAREDKAAKEKAAHDAEIKKERERDEKLEADAKALRDAQSKKEADAKAKADAEIKAAEKAKKDAELAPDKIKLEKLRDAIISLQMPSVTSAEAKEVIRKVKVLLGKTETFINEQKDSL